MTSLQLFWLGAPAIIVDGQPIHMETRKTTALLAYLSVTQQSLTRDFLETLFWPEYDQKHAQANLRRSIFSIKKSFPEEILISDGAAIRFREGSAWSDVDEFRQRLEAPQAHGHTGDDFCNACVDSLNQASDLYRGEFMAGFNLPDCPMFDEWQFLQRAEYCQAYTKGLEKLVRRAAEHGVWEEAISYARRWVALDRLNETAQRRLIELYHQAGRPSLALHQYNDYANLSKELLGQAPDPDIFSLHNRLGNSPAHEPEQAKSVQLPSKPAIPLLKTKLFVPSLRQKHIQRSRLVACLQDALAVKLTLISAPAGFGKTTFLSEWIATISQSIAWVSLDREDNDPLRFVYYLAAALENAQSEVSFNLPEVGQLLQLIPMPSVLEILIDRISAIPEPIFLVFDDYQFIHAQAVHDVVNFLIEHLPAQMHLVIATRTDPPLLLPRLRVSGQLIEIRAAELRFSLAESTELLNKVLNFHLSPLQILTLQTRTEGWIAGLQMAALAMQGALASPGDAGEDPYIQVQKDLAGFVETFSGSNRHIMDYLMEEVLHQSSRQIQQFLLKSSILDQFTAADCDAIFNTGGSQLILEQLEKENLFLIPLDTERVWYRYHHLFGELLQNRLIQTLPDQVSQLHRQASQWYEANHNVPEAVRHAQATGDIQRVNDLVEAHTLALMDYGELSGLVEWLSALDRRLQYSRPYVSVAHAWALLYAGQLDDIDDVLHYAEEAILPGQTINETRDIQGQISAIRAYLSSLKGDGNSKERYALEALALLPQQNAMVRAFAAGQLAQVYRLRGKLEEAARILVQVIAQNPQVQDSHIGVDITCDLAGIRMAQGRRHEAAAIFQEIISRSKKATERGSRPVSEIASAFINYGWVLREWNDLPAAMQYTQEAIRLAEQWGQKELLLTSYFEWARLLQALEDPSAATLVMQKAKSLAHTLSPFTRSIAEREEVHLWLKQGNLQSASDWRKASGLTAQDEVNIGNRFVYRLFANVILAEGSIIEAIPLLEHLLSIEEEIGEGEQVIRILALLSLAFYQLGRFDQAAQVLEKGLALAEPEGFMRTFLEEGAPMAELLRYAYRYAWIKDARLKEHLAKLLSAFNAAG